MRVVSLVPSLTETLLEWNVDVVGRTRFCLHGSAPQLGGTKDPDVAAVVALAPDLVVANREENRKEDVDALVSAGIEVLVTDIGSLPEAASELRRIGTAVGRTAEADVLAVSIDRIPRHQPSVPAVCYIWRRPWMAVGTGTYAHDVLAAAGFGNVITEPRYPDVGLAQRDDAVALLPSEPYPFTTRQVPEVEAEFGVGRALLIDGQALTWYGPRTPLGVAALRRVAQAVS